MKTGGPEGLRRVRGSVERPKSDDQTGTDHMQDAERWQHQLNPHKRQKSLKLLLSTVHPLITMATKSNFIRTLLNDMMGNLTPKQTSCYFAKQCVTPNYESVTTTINNMNLNVHKQIFVTLVIRERSF